MKYIALEEAFSIPELDRLPFGGYGPRRNQRRVEDWARKLPDFTEYRLPDMDAAGIDIQVLSLTIPGLQADIDPAAAREDARFANDYLARVGAEHPDRFRGFAALPMQDRRPPSRSWNGPSASWPSAVRWSTTTCKATTSTIRATTGTLRPR